MEWLRKLIETHTKDGKLDLDALMTATAIEFPKHAVPKDTYNTVAEAKKELEKDIATRDKQIEDLKKVDAASLQAEIIKLQGENKTAKEKYEADMKALALSNAIKLALTGKAHDPDIVANLLDKSKIELNEDGTVKAGLDEQVKSLKESKAFLFAEEKKDDGGGFQFKGFKPAEGSEGEKGKGSEGDKEGAFGRRLADFAKSNEGLEKARQSYFE
ncbi:phage scaffolding protein [Desulfitobacterium hafniense]|uniref:phage scaffolding protein n=1 Tax=Desulfitobacterium hafniense TaxID=49338 RepID=UPI00036E60CF|nr:phage scaffolding protein [Desulfitobacterium hafniense]